MPAEGQVLLSSPPLGNVNSETAVSSLLFAFAATNDFQLEASTPPSAPPVEPSCALSTKHKAMEHLSAMRDEADAGGCHEQAECRKKNNIKH